MGVTISTGVHPGALNFQWGGINFFENSLGMQVLIENALGLRKSVKKTVTPMHPGAPWPGQWDRVLLTKTEQGNSW